MRELATTLSLLSTLSGSCGHNPSTCESLWGNDCKNGCSCPQGHECRIYSDGLGGSGQNSCFKFCTRNSDCPESTYCVEVEVGVSPSETAIEGQCWPECKDNGCPPWTRCQSTRLYPDAGAIKACF